MNDQPNPYLTPPVRTDAQILARMKELSVTGSNFFNFEHDDLLQGLSFEAVKPFLQETATREEWAEFTRVWPAVILDYLPFAIGKAQNHRGLSAQRSRQHFLAWIWLDGNDDLYVRVQQSGYKNYGTPALKLIAYAYDYPWPVDDEELNNMAEGRKCRPDCDKGCA